MTRALWLLYIDGNLHFLVSKNNQEHGSFKYRAEVLYFLLKERSIGSVFVLEWREMIRNQGVLHSNVFSIRLSKSMVHGVGCCISLCFQESYK